MKTGWKGNIEDLLEFSVEFFWGGWSVKFNDKFNLNLTPNTKLKKYEQVEGLLNLP